MNSFSRIARRAASRFFTRFAGPIRCGGCGREKGGVLRMVAGPNVYFCDQCFERAAHQLAPRRPAPDATRCRFCRLLRPSNEVTTVGSIVVCADCLGMMDVILAEAAQHPRRTT